MSWQLGAFGLLALGLGAGFWWYERTRPDAKTVALVGTLAALACLGRVAFAAVPNVKPTTDIVLISGFALGGAPGYVVGAVAALSSNLFFGQGPWTPWQMAGWGLTGILGAVLARGGWRLLADRDGAVRRWALALVCFVVGFAFTALQDLGDWVTYSDHSGGQLVAYVGQGLGYDLIHAVGCLGFALAFGPAMIRSLQRFRRRLTVRWVTPSGGTVSGAVVAMIAVGAIASADAPSARAATLGSSVNYLVSAQNHDGGFGSAPRQSSDPMSTGWVILALAAAGRPAGALVPAGGGQSAISYLQRTVRADLGDPGSVERTVLAAVAAGLNPGDVGGRDLRTALQREFRANGSIAGQTNLTAFGVLAARAAGIRVPAQTVPWLLRQQDSDGGFNFATRGASSDVDDTGATLEALAAAARSHAFARAGAVGSPIPRSGAEHAAVERALGYLRAQQHRDGGFPSEPGGPSNSQSTAFAVQGLIAVGVRPAAVHLPGGRTPLQYLAARTGADGAIRYSAGSDQTPVWVTAEALLALSGRPLPIAPPHRAGGSPPARSRPAPPQPPKHRSASSHRAEHPMTSSHAAKHRTASHRTRRSRSHRSRSRPASSGAARTASRQAPSVGQLIGWLGAAEGAALGIADGS